MMKKLVLVAILATSGAHIYGAAGPALERQSSQEGRVIESLNGIARLMSKKGQGAAFSEADHVNLLDHLSALERQLIVSTGSDGLGILASLMKNSIEKLVKDNQQLDVAFKYALSGLDPLTGGDLALEQAEGTSRREEERRTAAEAARIAAESPVQPVRKRILNLVQLIRGRITPEQENRASELLDDGYLGRLRVNDLHGAEAYLKMFRDRPVINEVIPGTSVTVSKALDNALKGLNPIAPGQP